MLFLLIPWIKPGVVLISPIADRVVVWLSFYLSLISLEPGRCRRRAAH
jgi:hypothetical protein